LRATLTGSSHGSVRRWFASLENQAAAKIRRSGATVRIFTIQGLPAGG